MSLIAQLSKYIQTKLLAVFKFDEVSSNTAADQMIQLAHVYSWKHEERKLKFWLPSFLRSFKQVDWKFHCGLDKKQKKKELNI